MRAKKALFYGSLEQEGCSGGQRLWALREIGLEVCVLDKSKFKKNSSRIRNHAARLLKTPLALWAHQRLSEEFLRLCDSEKPDIVWMEWPREIAPSTMAAARRILPNAGFISMQDDNPWGDRKADVWMWREYFKVVTHFDLHLVKRESDTQNLKSLGAGNCRLWEHGIFKPTFYPKLDTNKRYPISFVGTCMDSRAELIGYLLQQGLPVHVFGTHWDKRSSLPTRYPDQFHGPVRADAYANVIRESHLCLGLVSHSNHDQWTMRSYEVPGCAGALLAERTPYHSRIFEDGITAALFSDPDECARKCSELFADPELTRHMGWLAYEEFLAKRRTLEQRMKELFDNLEFPST